MDATPTKLTWIPLDIAKTLAEWRFMDDFQRGWYIQLLLSSAISELPGYLPADSPDVPLWKLAGARTKQFWEQKSAVVLARFKRRQLNGQEWIYNEDFLRMVEKQTTKIRTIEEKRSRKLSGKEDGEQTLPLFSSSTSTDVAFELNQCVEELFQLYQDAFCRDSGYTLTDSRRRVCELRLKECLEANGGDLGAALNSAKTAITNLSRSEFHLHHGYFDWIDHLFKTREVFEKRVGMKLPAKRLQAGTRAGAFAEPSSGDDQVLPDWLADVAKKPEAERRTMLGVPAQSIK